MDMKAFSLEGKIAWITGASYGIGFAIAEAYAAAGATIVFNDINEELVNKGLAAYEAKGIKAHGYVCDVTNEEAVQALVKKIEAEVGVVDILVNNAGIAFKSKKRLGAPGEAVTRSEHLGPEWTKSVGESL